MRLRFAIEHRSWSSAVMAARIFLVPTEYSIRNLFRSGGSHAARIAAPPWVRAQTKTQTETQSETRTRTPSSRVANLDPLRSRMATRAAVGPAPLDHGEPDPSGTVRS